ncbi:ABC transporter substrate-binding protein [Variovorax rhizosphaerae]|uniref:ABC transporter substrate-binding protein n=1 Tax=Variovorax rhizosphaerae TaxID=1836200 RepID=A0ABU8WXD0_9BURK
MLGPDERTLATPIGLRRAVSVSLGCTLFSLPFVRAQSGKKIHRLGVLWLGEPHPILLKPFLNELQRMGMADGSNLLVDHRSATGPSGLDEAAVDLAALKPDVIFVPSGTMATKAVAKATSSIPIVFLLSNDPVARGLVASLTRPGGNITGNAIFSRQLDLKRFQLLTQVIGEGVSVGVLDMQFPGDLLEAYKKTPSGRAGRIHYFEIKEQNDFAKSFEQIAAKGLQGLAINSFPLAGANKAIVAALVARYRLPAVADGREFSDAGVLLTYSPDFKELAVSAAGMVYKILNGTKPSELAVWQPMRYEMIVNLGTAKALGVTVPRDLVARADLVIN